MAILQRFEASARARTRLSPISNPTAQLSQNGSPASRLLGEVTFNSLKTPQTQTYADLVNIELTYDQRSRLELLAIHAGKSTTALLLDAAQMLLEEDEQDSAHQPQRFLSEQELEARFVRLLRY